MKSKIARALIIEATNKMSAGKIQFNRTINRPNTGGNHDQPSNKSFRENGN